jgi:hypothetical protein
MKENQAPEFGLNFSPQYADDSSVGVFPFTTSPAPPFSRGIGRIGSEDERELSRSAETLRSPSGSFRVPRPGKLNLTCRGCAGTPNIGCLGTPCKGCLGIKHSSSSILSLEANLFETIWKKTLQRDGGVLANHSRQCCPVKGLAMSSNRSGFPSTRFRWGYRSPPW